jgi:hypothetical protein
MKTIVICGIVLLTLSQQNTWAQTIDKILDAFKLKNNVVKITTTFENGTDENGFGTVIAERDNKLYVVTAKHVIYDLLLQSKTKNVLVNFYNKPGENFSGSLLNLPENPADISLFVVEKPKGYSWSKKYYTNDIKKGTPVWFVGRAGEWYVPVSPGFVNITIAGDILVELNSVQPGTSGAPLVTLDGIAGLICEDGSDVAKAYSADKIIKLVRESWHYEWQIKPRKVMQELHFGVGIWTWQNENFDSELSHYLYDLGIHTDYHMNTTGAICFGYRRYTHKKRFSVGATLIFENNTAEYGFTAEYKSNGVYFLIETRYYYIHQRRFQLFSGFSPGIAFIEIKDSNSKNGISLPESITQFAFQANLIGVRVGGKVAGFVEVGLGYKGALNVGVSHRF